jgi:hypothetical protein
VSDDGRCKVYTSYDVKTFTYKEWAHKLCYLWIPRRPDKNSAEVGLNSSFVLLAGSGSQIFRTLDALGNSRKTKVTSRHLHGTGPRQAVKKARIVAAAAVDQTIRKRSFD